VSDPRTKKPKGQSPTSRTLQYLKKQGWCGGVVEKWNHITKIRQDLFGIIDIVALCDTDLIGIQATSDANVSSRVEKIKASPYLRPWLQTGAKVEVWGWAKKGARGKAKRWTLRVVPITEAPPLDGDCDIPEDV
jgi:hypothetical protein